LEVVVVLAPRRRACHRDRRVSRQLWNSVPCEKWRRNKKDGTRAVGHWPICAAFALLPVRANAAGGGAARMHGSDGTEQVGSGARGRSGCPPPPVGRRSPEMGVGIVRRPTGLQEHVRIPL